MTRRQVNLGAPGGGVVHAAHPVEYTRVYTPRGKVAHLITTAVAFAVSLCEREAPKGGGWYGTGDYAETQRAKRLPLCRTCKERRR